MTKVKLIPMSLSMRRLRDEMHYACPQSGFVPKNGDDYVDYSPSYKSLDFDYKPWATLFASYSGWGIWTIECAFIKRMREPFPGDNKRIIKREIQSNPHLSPPIKKRLLKVLTRVRVKRDWIRDMDTSYFKRIMSFREAGTESFDQLRNDIANNSNLSNEIRQNLILNLEKSNTLCA